MFRYHYAYLDRPDAALGEIAARDEHAAREQLARQGWDIDRLRLTLSEAHDEYQPAAPAPASTSLSGQRLTGVEASELTSQITYVLQGQLPLPQGLRALASEASSRRWSRALTELAECLERGMSIDEALSRHGQRLPGVLRGLVAAPAARDRLPLLLTDFIDFQKRLSELQREARVSCLYPAFVVGMAIGVFAVYALIVAGPAAAMLDQMMFVTTMSTKVLEVLSRFALPILFSGVFAVALILGYIRLMPPSAARHRFYKRVPLFGAMWRWSVLGQWTKQMAILLEAALPLPRGLRLVADGLSDADLAQATLATAANVERGHSLGEAVSRSPAFPASMSAMLAWADEARQLPETLDAISSLCESRMRREVVLIEMVLPAIAFLLVAWGAVFVVANTMGPMLRLIQALT